VIQSLLIANRGEIACRIIRTARRLGIRTIAVYSDADAKALHVRLADEAVRIGPPPARDSYLLGNRIIAAARQTGAQAIHPGYGFLSENAEFAEAVTAAGLIWVGATPHSIRAMGLKDAAKALMQSAGVPVTPGYLGEDQSPARLQEEADAIGYPILIKAIAGGGGKGMRRVDASANFPDALASCRREALAAFGDDRVLLEKYILSPRHIEVQVFGDTHGNIVHLFERDCSLQRRHQKVIEEAPAPGMDEGTRETLCAAAVRAAKAVDYVGAGTIEFIADASHGLSADRIWFMEMNTRLQVEHPVTEEITGVDLVEWQLRVASGEPLPMAQEDLRISGHAVEARLYAEDPSRGFLPTAGAIHLLPDEILIRVDSGCEGQAIPPYYDPMIAKLIAHARTREAALDKLAHVLERSQIGPITTNAQFLYRALRHPDFKAGAVDTGFIERHLDDLTATAPLSSAGLDLAADYFVGLRFQFDAQYAPGDIWHGARGFRLNGAAQQHVQLMVEGERVEGRYGVTFGTERTDKLFPFFDGETVWINEDGRTHQVSLYRPRVTAGGAAGSGAILAPMPGRVIAVDVVPGQSVTKGQKLLTVEAMKMEHSLTAPFDGTVAELPVEAGAQVQVEALLARIEPAEEAA